MSNGFRSMTDYYSILGVPEDVSPQDIKRAFRAKAFEHHPDANRAAGDNGRKQFQKVLEAYEVLKDPGKRASYDLLRRHNPVSFGDCSTTGSQKTGFDERQYWEEFTRRMQKEYESTQQVYSSKRRGDPAADARAWAEAWEREKQEAKENKARGARLRRKTQYAKQARQAATLRRFWQSHPGFTWQDVAVAVMFVTSSVGLALNWKWSREV